MTGARGASATTARRKAGTRAALSLAAVVALASSHTIGDVLLVGAGVATAGASAVFAGLMVKRADGRAHINGIEYLAIFSRPNGVTPPPTVAQAPPAEPERRAAVAEIDMTPTGSIGKAERVAPMPDDGFHIIGGRQDFVWMRRGQIIRAVRPGDVVAGLGYVGSIEQRRGGWALLDASGALLLANDAAAKSGERANRSSKGLIFN